VSQGSSIRQCQRKAWPRSVAPIQILPQLMEPVHAEARELLCENINPWVGSWQDNRESVGWGVLRRGFPARRILILSIILLQELSCFFLSGTDIDGKFLAVSHRSYITVTCSYTLQPLGALQDHDFVEYVNLGSQKNSWILLNLIKYRRAHSKAVVWGKGKHLFRQRWTCK
jgi:hypothetical protein